MGVRARASASSECLGTEKVSDTPLSLAHARPSLSHLVLLLLLLILILLLLLLLLILLLLLLVLVVGLATRNGERKTWRGREREGVR